MAKADNMLAILKIHVRTVYRCIDALCASGVPIVAETGRDGGYSIPVGFCHLRGEIRSFRVDRIGRIRQTGIPFQRPASFSAREHMLSSLLPESADADDQRVIVRIAGSPQALDDLCDHWLFGHALIERSPDQAVFQLDEHSLFAHAPYYLLSFGVKIRVLDPPELKTCLAEIAESLLRFYRS